MKVYGKMFKLKFFFVLELLEISIPTAFDFKGNVGIWALSLRLINARDVLAQLFCAFRAPILKQLSSLCFSSWTPAVQPSTTNCQKYLNFIAPFTASWRFAVPACSEGCPPTTPRFPSLLGGSYRGNRTTGPRALWTYFSMMCVFSKKNPKKYIKDFSNPG